MSKVRDDLKGIHHHLGVIFDYFYVQAKLSFQNDSVFDDIIDGVNYALKTTFWPHKHEGEIFRFKIDLVLERWKLDRDVLQHRGAGMNYEAIPYLKRKVLEVIETA